MKDGMEMWTKVAIVSDVPSGEAYDAEVDGRHYALFNVDGDIHACDGICTHALAFLADGYLEGDEIECPLHAGKFNVRTGKALCGPVKKDLATYPVRIENNEILVNLAEGRLPE
jgi:nitrite reductase/ring-hydroxylating ferredoxin subunit